MCRLILDLTKPPVITDEQKARLAALAANPTPDELIDYSDAPHLPDATWVKALNVRCSTRPGIKPSKK